MTTANEEECLTDQASIDRINQDEKSSEYRKNYFNNYQVRSKSKIFLRERRISKNFFDNVVTPSSEIIHKHYCEQNQNTF